MAGTTLANYLRNKVAGMTARFRIGKNSALEQLTEDWGFSFAIAERILEIAREIGPGYPDTEPVEDGLIRVTFHGRSHERPHGHLYSIEPDVGPPRKTGESSRGKPPAKVAGHAVTEYTNPTKPVPTRRESPMPPRGRNAKAAEQEEEVQEAAAPDFSHHLTKDLSPTMSDYGDWFHENVTDIDELGKTDPGRLLALGSSLYPHFQKSDLNQSNRAARQATRQAAAPANGAGEEEEETPKPARGRGAKPAATAKTEAAPKPAPPRRGRAAAATASAAAPY